MTRHPAPRPTAASEAAGTEWEIIPEEDEMLWEEESAPSGQRDPPSLTPTPAVPTLAYRGPAQEIRHAPEHPGRRRDPTASSGYLGRIDRAQRRLEAARSAAGESSDVGFVPGKVASLACPRCLRVNSVPVAEEEVPYLCRSCGARGKFVPRRKASGITSGVSHPADDTETSPRPAPAASGKSGARPSPSAASVSPTPLFPPRTLHSEAAAEDSSSDSPAIKVIRCPRCKTVFDVAPQVGSFQVSCPSCGTGGTIRGKH